jgi:hypothetical protein
VSLYFLSLFWHIVYMAGKDTLISGALSGEGSDLADLGGSSFSDMADKLLKTGENTQAFFEKNREMALSETDPIRKAQYTNMNNESVNALTIQFQLNFLRVGAELMKIPGILKNG